MDTFDENEREQWNTILREASLELTQLVAQHRVHRASQLKSEEQLLLGQSKLIELEALKLVKYGGKKNVNIQEQQRNKCERDNAPIAISSNSESHSLEAEPTDCPEGNSEKKKNETVCSAPKVISLSSSPLSSAQLYLLSKGLAFCPASGSIVSRFG